MIKPIQTIDFIWAFVLRLLDGGRTRLLIRARSNYTPRAAAWFVELVIGPGDFVNAGAMLGGIKRRVERRRPPAEAAPEARKTLAAR